MLIADCRVPNGKASMPADSRQQDALNHHGTSTRLNQQLPITNQQFTQS
jgi:hypothetical protein